MVEVIFWGFGNVMGGSGSFMVLELSECRIVLGKRMNCIWFCIP